MCQHAVARPELAGGGNGRELVPAKVHAALDRTVQLTPRSVDGRPVRERSREVIASRSKRQSDRRAPRLPLPIQKR